MPFAVPGSEKIQNLDDATGILATKLTEHGITPKTLPPTDRLGVVANAAQICAQTGASGILVPTARTEQGERKKNYVLVTVPYFATHVEVRLARLRCDGTLAWSFVTFGDKDYYNSNVQAAVADGITQATGRAIDAYVARPPDPAPATPPAPASPPAALRRRLRWRSPAKRSRSCRSRRPAASPIRASTSRPRKRANGSSSAVSRPS